MLPAPEVSENVLFEDLQQVRDVRRSLQLVDTHTGKLSSVIQLDRGLFTTVQPHVLFDVTHARVALAGSGVVVTVNLRDSNLAPLFEPVQHADSNDDRAFEGDRTVLRHYCPHPLPEMYELSFELHQVTSSRASPVYSSSISMV